MSLREQRVESPLVSPRHESRSESSLSRPFNFSKLLNFTFACTKAPRGCLVKNAFFSGKKCAPTAKSKLHFGPRFSVFFLAADV
jgi:hypothetical protein